MLELIISGIGLGIVLSFLTGPVFFALIKTSIEKGFHAGIALATGVVVSDAVYVVITLYGTSLLSFESQYRLPIGIVGSAVLLGIGSYYLFKKVKINNESIPSSKNNIAFFLKGFFMCIFNPFILLYWISITSGIYSISGEINNKQVIPFFGVILITLYGMDITKAYFANKFRNKIKETTIQMVNRIAGILIIIFALKLIYNLIFTETLI